MGVYCSASELAADVETAPNGHRSTFCRHVMCAPHTTLLSQSRRNATKSVSGRQQTLPPPEQSTRSSDHMPACNLKSHISWGGIMLLFYSVLRKQTKKQRSEECLLQRCCNLCEKRAYLSVSVVFLFKIQSLASHIRGAFSLIIFYLFTFFSLCIVCFGFQCMCGFTSVLSALLNDVEVGGKKNRS